MGFSGSSPNNKRYAYEHATPLWKYILLILSTLTLHQCYTELNYKI